MKKLSLIFLSVLLVFPLFGQEEKRELSDYEKYRIEKEKEEYPDIVDTVYVYDTVYLDSDPEIVNNYYVDDWPSMRYRLSFGYDHYYYDPFYYDYGYYSYSYWNYSPYTYWGYRTPYRPYRYYNHYYPYNAYNHKPYYRQPVRKTTYGPRDSRSGYTTYGARKAPIRASGTHTKLTQDNSNVTRTRIPISEREYATQRYTTKSRTSYPSTTATRSRTYTPSYTKPSGTSPQYNTYNNSRVTQTQRYNSTPSRSSSSTYRSEPTSYSRPSTSSRPSYITPSRSSSSYGTPSRSSSSYGTPSRSSSSYGRPSSSSSSVRSYSSGTTSRGSGGKNKK